MVCSHLSWWTCDSPACCAGCVDTSHSWCSVRTRRRALSCYVEQAKTSWTRWNATSRMQWTSLAMWWLTPGLCQEAELWRWHWLMSVFIQCLLLHEYSSVVTVWHWPRSVGFGSVWRKKSRFRFGGRFLRECCGQRTLSGVFKAGDFHRNTGRRLLIDVTLRGG